MEKEIKLHLDFATYESAVFACKNWHYSHSIPAGKITKIGVWENDVFKGVVLFSRGANKSIGGPYGLGQDECCELTRIALTKHHTPVTKIVSIAFKLLKQVSPGIKLIVSYADIDQNHEGGIYKAGNWIYVGVHGDGSRTGFILFGQKKHNKSIHSLYGHGSQRMEFLKKIDPNVKEFFSKGKHKYLYVLDEKIRPDIIKLAKPFDATKG